MTFFLKTENSFWHAYLMNIYDTGSGFKKLLLWWRTKIQNNYMSAKSVCTVVTGSQPRELSNHQGRALSGVSFVVLTDQ